MADASAPAGAAGPPPAPATTAPAKKAPPPRDYHYRPWLGPLIAACLLGAASLVFYVRKPVLVVGDSDFSALYGVQREKKARIFAMAGLFRRVKPLTIAGNAEPDAAAYAIADAAKGALCVLFPYRYADIAGRYAALDPAAPALLLADRNPPPDTLAPGVTFIPTDFEADAASAARAALTIARFQVWAAARANEKAAQQKAKETGEPVEPDPPPEPGRLIVFEEERATEAAREAFRAVLAADGYPGEAVFRGLTADSQTPDTGCVVLGGQAQNFILANSRVPMAAFTWFDPAFMPANTVLVFDDSPLALAPGLVRDFTAGKKAPDGGFPPQAAKPRLAPNLNWRLAADLLLAFKLRGFLPIL